MTSTSRSFVCRRSHALTLPSVGLSPADALEGVANRLRVVGQPFKLAEVVLRLLDEIGSLSSAFPCCRRYLVRRYAGRALDERGIGYEGTSVPWYC